MKTELEAPIPARREAVPGRAPTRSLRFLPLVLLATIGGVLLATARYGIGLTPDSVVYVLGARNLAHGHGYTNNGRIITDFPPGYSAVLSLSEHVGIGAIDAARVIAVLGFVATVALGYVLLRRHCRAPAVIVGATTLLACSAVLLDVYEKALSEHLFIPVTLVFVLLLEEQMSKPRSTALFICSVVCVWAAFYVRYIGLVFIIVGALILVVADWKRSRTSALLRASAFAVIAAAAPILWMLRNVDDGGHPMGHRSSASATVFSNASRVLKQVSTWTTTDAGPSVVRALALIALGGVVVLLWRGKGTRERERIDWRPLVPIVVLIVVYVAYLMASASIIAFGSIANTRFMVPVYVPSVVLGAWAFEQLRARIDDAKLRRLANIAAATFVAVNVVWFAARAVNAAREGAGGYATARYHDSEILAASRKLDLSIPTFSNDAPAVTVLTGRTVQPSVARTYFNSDDETGKLDNFVHLVNCRGKAQLIWFVPNPRPFLYTPAQLAKRVSLQAIVKRRDGTIYDVVPLPDAAPCG